MAIDHYSTLDGLTKKDNYKAILRATAISLIEENYPEPHWTRIFPDGSKINETAGTGVYSIQAISNNHHSETQIEKDINILRDKNIQIIFQWIPSPVGNYGIEEANQLAKRGNQKISDQNLITPDSLKKHVHKNIENSCRDNLNAICKEWQHIQITWKTYNLRPRKEAVSHCRLMTITLEST
ncbi:hypothetical protein NPIL_211491 [Nephila pilipes]|uniref:Uncharacterized protein n=1 Tax=Nephila pilipes TaxID=299642 RepID=A0A8X6MHL5_NEPPI|nr:hypothetical protein NPIL_211491 [Nephila pilipes]